MSRWSVHPSPRVAPLACRLPRVRGAAPLAAFVLLSAAVAPAAAQTRYPESRVAPVVDTLHGVAITDDYRWLEDQQSAETRAWIGAQNRFREQRLASLPGREAIASRLRELLMVDVLGTPTVRGGRYFYTRRAADQDYALSKGWLKSKIDINDLIDPSYVRYANEALRNDDPAQKERAE